MGIFNRFPYSSTHEMNLDFMLGKAQEINEQLQHVETGMQEVQTGLSQISEQTERATAAATAAEEAKEDSQQNERDAFAWAEQAEQHADRAETALSQMTDDADRAEAAADRAEAAADAASISASAASNSANIASQNAATAAQQAANAQLSAQSAQGALNQATVAANNAQTNAVSAADAAALASGYNSQAATSATNAATSASNAATSAASVLEVEQNVQDLVDGLPADFTDLNTKVNDMQSALKLELTWNDGAYLSGDSSTYNTNTSFKWSTPFYLDKKCTLHIKVRGYNTVVNIVSKTSQNAGYYTEIARCTDSVYKWYTVEINEPGYYIICGNNSASFEIIAYITESIESQNVNALAMFNKIVCCGDSLTYGLVYESATVNRQAKKPYNEAITQITGVPSERYATAGYTAKDWWDNFNTHLNENALYIIFLGTNGGLTDTITEDCPGTDPAEFADTNTGCYGKILQTLTTNRKTAVLIKPPTGSTVTNSVIEKFSKKYNMPTISLPDLTNNYYHYSPHNTGYTNTVHYNDYGYVHIANCIVYAINNMSLRNLFLISPYS